MAIQHDARHISQTNDFQPQMTNWYVVQIDRISEDITLSATAISLPNIGTPVVELPYGNTSAKVAGQANFEDVSFRIKDAIVKDVESQIRDWQQEVYNSDNGEMGWVEEYKRTMTITQYGPHGEAQRVWEFYGVWPSQINYGGMDHSNSSAKEIDITLSYDWAIRTPLQM